MNARPTVVLLALAAACGGSKSADTAAMADTAADEAALATLHNDYVTHFNMHHASVVGEMYSDSAVFLPASGAVEMGKPAIISGMEAQMAAAPTLGLTPAETMVHGDYAVTHGAYTLSMTPPGGSAVTQSGNYMTMFARENGAWKISGVVSNFDSPPPEGFPWAPATTAPPPPENGTLKALADAYTTHFNLGHASMVADLYTEDAWVSFADRAPVSGRAAIEAALTELMAQGSPQITIHDVGTEPFGEGTALDGGWYELKTKAGQPMATGAYMMVVRQGADGSWKIARAVSNSRPATN